MKTRTLSVLALSVLLTTACGESNFGGKDGKRAESERAAGADGDDGAGKGDDATPAKDDGGKGDDHLSLDPPADATPEQEAIGKCLEAWGNHPFDGTVYQKYRKIHAAVTVFGGGGYAVEDTEVTDGPALVVVSASVSVMGQANYLLMNPNGWYCLMVDVNVMSKSAIDLQCKAHLADNKVNVNVGSKTQNTAAVGVNVFSDVKVNRKKDANAEPGCG